MTLKAKDHCCEEAALGMGDAYIPCNKLATSIVGTRRPTEGPYRMCAACADHSVKNRGMIWITAYNPFIGGLIDAAKAAVAYDALMQSAANDPQKMATATTAEGDDLDTLYEAWITKSRSALAFGS